jgi:hypothetical protein
MYTLMEQSDVFVDAVAVDHCGQLLFVSTFGRDTSIQQFMARLHQPVKEGGVDGVTVVDPDNRQPAMRMLVGDARRLEKITGRMPRARLLGNLVHTWIFNPSMFSVDHACRSAWHFDVEPLDGDRWNDAAWQIVKDLSPVPLLDDWRETVIDAIADRGGLKRPPTLGAIRTLRIELDDGFEHWVSTSLKAGVLRAPSPNVTSLPLLAAA